MLLDRAKRSPSGFNGSSFNGRSGPRFGAGECSAGRRGFRPKVVIQTPPGMADLTLEPISSSQACEQTAPLVASTTHRGILPRGRNAAFVQAMPSHRSSPSALLRAALRELPSRFAGELVWPGEGGRNLTKSEAKWPLWRACKRAGLRRVGWHALRHTFASHLVMRGVPLKATLVAPCERGTISRTAMPRRCAISMQS